MFCLEHLDLFHYLGLGLRERAPGGGLSATRGGGAAGGPLGDQADRGQRVPRGPSRRGEPGRAERGGHGGSERAAGPRGSERGAHGCSAALVPVTRQLRLPREDCNTVNPTTSFSARKRASVAGRSLPVLPRRWWVTLSNRSPQAQAGIPVPRAALFPEVFLPQRSAFLAGLSSDLLLKVHMPCHSKASFTRPPLL